jgi:hypothetical protein
MTFSNCNIPFDNVTPYHMKELDNEDPHLHVHVAPNNAGTAKPFANMVSIVGNVRDQGVYADQCCFSLMSLPWQLLKVKNATSKRPLRMATILLASRLPTATTLCRCAQSIQ